MTKSGERLGASTVATIFIGLTFIGICTNVFTILSEIANDGKTIEQQAITVLSILIYIVAFYIYTQHYQACQSWKGWFLCVVGSQIAFNLLRRFITSPPKTENTNDVPLIVQKPAPLPQAGTQPATTSVTPTQPATQSVTSTQPATIVSPTPIVTNPPIK